MRIEEFVNQFREKTGDRYKDLGDFEIVTMVSAQKPQLLKKIDRKDIEVLGRETRKKRIAKERQKTFKSLSGVSRFGIGAERGMMDVFMGIKQMLKPSESTSYSPYGSGFTSAPGEEEQYKAEKQEYKEASEGDLAAGLGEVAGAMAPTLLVPGMTAQTTMGKLGMGLATGAGLGASEFVDEDETRLKNTLYGSLFGAGGALAGKVVGKSFNALKKRYKNANAQELMELAETHGIKPSLGDITGSQALRKAETLTENIPGVGMSGFREKGAEKVGEAAKDVVEKAKKEMLETGEDLGDDWTRILQKSGAKVAKAKRQQATKLYNEVEDLAGESEVFTENTKAKVKEAIEDAGILEDEAVTGLLGKLDQGLTKKQTFQDMRKLRSKLGAKAEDLSLSNRDAARKLREVKEAVELDLNKHTSGDIDAFHGSDSKIKDIDFSKSNQSSRTGVPKGVAFLTDDADVAKSYGENVLKKKIKMNNPLVVDAKGRPWDEIDFVSDRGVKTVMNINELANYAKTVSKLKGYDGLVVKNVRDTGGKSGKPGGFTMSTSYAVFEETQKKGDALKKAARAADAFYKKEVVPLKDRMLAKALKTDEPDQIYKKFIQRGAGDRANKFYNALDQKGQSSVRYGMLVDAYEKASKDGVFSPKKFTSRLKDLKSPKNVFFKGDRGKELDGFEKLMEHSERFGQFAENPPTGQRIAQMLGAASYTTLGIPATALGVRLLSTPAGKRLILAASELDPGSSKMEALIEKFQRNLPKISTQSGKELGE